MTRPGAGANPDQVYVLPAPLLRLIQDSVECLRLRGLRWFMQAAIAHEIRTRWMDDHRDPVPDEYLDAETSPCRASRSAFAGTSRRPASDERTPSDCHLRNTAGASRTGRPVQGCSTARKRSPASSFRRATGGSDANRRSDVARRVRL